MTTHVFSNLKAIAKQFTMLMVGVFMVLSFTQTAAYAFPLRPVTESWVLLEISETIPDAELSEKREQRREWQSKASSSQSVDDNGSASLGETLNDKLNLGEITETMKDNLNLDGADENAAEKVQQRSKFNLPENRQ